MPKESTNGIPNKAIMRSANGIPKCGQHPEDIERNNTTYLYGCSKSSSERLKESRLQPSVLILRAVIIVGM